MFFAQRTLEAKPNEYPFRSALGIDTQQYSVLDDGSAFRQETPVG
jgi:hypothetical protein